MESRIWYAVQMDREDDWGTGSYDLGEAMLMAERMEAGLIAVIEEGHDSVCIDEIVINR